MDDILKIVKGPDFPTGAMILGSCGIKEAYKTGRGKVKVRRNKLNRANAEWKKPYNYK